MPLFDWLGDLPAWVVLFNAESSRVVVLFDSLIVSVRDIRWHISHTSYFEALKNSIVTEVQA